ncbi:MAG: acetyl-CoA C-acyltransferase [Saprospiraceae bacterium]|nr:acetyl-CoA C-acyltransferase [Saprospiraceae bacterium]
MQSPVYIVDGVRTAIGNFKGSLSSVRTDDLASMPIKFLADKYRHVTHDQYDDVIMGCANQAGEDNRNVARMALLLAGLPYTVPGETINRLCASGMSAIIHAQRAILSGHANLIIAGGVENMTRAPWVTSKSSTPFGNDVEMFDSSFGWRFINSKMKDKFGVDAMGETAENLVDLYNISRSDQDAYAYHSQMKASAARRAGIFDIEIMDVPIIQKKGEPIVFNKDEFIKEQTTIEGLSMLRTAFRKNGTVTAGNASGLNDGAAAVLVSSASTIEALELKPIASIVSSAVVGVEPRIMGIGPVEASRSALKKAGLNLDDMDIIEINEAFAAQVLACLRMLHIKDDDVRVNPNGGSIALGHPLGMSGTRLLLTAALELQRQKKRYALVTMCIGVGQGYAVIIENCFN